MQRSAALILLLAIGLAGCDEAPPGGAHDTSVLGGFGDAPRSAPRPGALADASGKPIPPPPTPRGEQAQMVRVSADLVLAVWVQDQQVVAATHTAAAGWSAPQALEQIYGESSRPRLASNGKGTAMAVWQHTVGSIQSLRSSRFDSAGWAVPDVMPGALPRPPAAGATPPQLHMDAQGRVFAEWPSGFADGELQTARHVPGEGWSRAASEPATAAGPASSSVQ